MVGYSSHRTVRGLESGAVVGGGHPMLQAHQRDVPRRQWELWQEGWWVLVATLKSTTPTTFQPPAHGPLQVPPWPSFSLRRALLCHLVCCLLPQRGALAWVPWRLLPTGFVTSDKMG